MGRDSAYTPATVPVGFARLIGVCTRIELAGRVCHRKCRVPQCPAKSRNRPLSRGAGCCSELQGFCSGSKENAYKVATSAGLTRYIAATNATGAA